jgi:hypothetical protein
MALSEIQPQTWLQQMTGTARQALDANKDGSIETAEVVDFLEQLLAAIRTETTGASYDSRTGAAIVTKPTPPLDPGSADGSTTPATNEGAGTGGWRDFVFGKSASGSYIGVMVAPSRDVPAGYVQGPYRHQLEGFNHAKFDPAHPEGMTLKMIAARIFEQFDVYSDTAIDDVIQAFQDFGIPAQKVGIDQIDFGNGQGPLDVIRNKAYLEGNTSAGKAWQWPPIESGPWPLDFTTAPGGAVGLTAAAAGVGGVPNPGAGAAGATERTAPTGSLVGSNLYPGTVDQLDLALVDWLDANVSKWPITSKLTDVQIGAGSITLEHTKSGQWPVLQGDGAPVEGNPWIFVNRGGRWYGATYEWLRPGQETKSIDAGNIGPHIKKEPLASWRPEPGELVGFMVSTPARTDERTVSERSNVVTVRWPG